MWGRPSVRPLFLSSVLEFERAQRCRARTQNPIDVYWTRAKAMTSHPQIPSPLDPVPQLDLAAQYAAIGGEIRTAVERVMASQQFVLGREGAALEEEIAKLCGGAPGGGLASGTDPPISALPAVRGQ